MTEPSKNSFEEMIKVLKNSNAISYEPNAYRIDVQLNDKREKFYVSDNDGRLTIDYALLAKAVFAAGYCKASDIANEFFEALKNTLEYIPWSVIELIRKYTMEENK